MSTSPKPKPKPLPGSDPGIIPPDPPPDPPDAAPAPPPSTKPTKRARDKSRESHPDFGDVRRMPRKSDPPIITGRMSRSTVARDNGGSSWRDYNVAIIGR